MEEARRGAKRAARLCDELYPLFLDPGADPFRYAQLQDVVRRELEAARRDPGSFLTLAASSMRITDRADPAVSSEERPISAPVHPSRCSRISRALPLPATRWSSALRLPVAHGDRALRTDRSCGPRHPAGCGRNRSARRLEAGGLLLKPRPQRECGSDVVVAAIPLDLAVFELEDRRQG
jgi:hypothetical protein